MEPRQNGERRLRRQDRAVATRVGGLEPDSSWGYFPDEVMADAESRAAIVAQRRLYLEAQMHKRGLEPVGDVTVARLHEKADEAPPGCSGYRFTMVHRVSEMETS